MTVLVTGFTGNSGYEVAQSLKSNGIPFNCAVRNVETAAERYGDGYDYVRLDFADAETFAPALRGITKLFLMYPPGGKLHFAEFLQEAKKQGVQHITYLSVKDAQFLPFIHHFKNEKLLKKLGLPYTFVRAGYFMQNLNDFLCEEIKQHQRIYVPAGKGKTSFVDVRNLADVVSLSFQYPQLHQYKAYVITGEQALDFSQIAEKMSEVLGKPITYTNPSAKEFKQYMISRGKDKGFINVVIGIHFPTKLGLAKGITTDYQKLTGHKPTNIEAYLHDYRHFWE